MPAVAVVGPGRMGVGIAAAFALAGQEVLVVDLKDRAAPLEAAQDARRRMRRELDVWVQVGVAGDATADDAYSRSTYIPESDADAALSDCDVVFEALPEVTDVKSAGLRRIGRATPHAVIGSTTSSFLADAMAGSCSRPERFLVTHWLNPAVAMPVVELSPGSRTAADAIARTEQVVRAVGKVPVACAASPALIIGRIWMLVLNEAARLLDEGVASAEDIDTACRLGLGVRLAAVGPLEFLEHGGVETMHRVAHYLQETVSSTRYELAATDGLRRLPRDATTLEHASRLVRSVRAVAE